MTHPLDEKDARAALDDLRLANDRRIAMAGLTLLLLTAIWLVRADVAFFDDDWLLLRDRLALRGCLVAAPIVGLIVLAFARSRPAYSMCVTLVAWTIAVFLVGISMVRPAGSGLPLRLPVVFLVVAYFTLTNSRWRQIGPPLAASAGLAALRLTWLSDDAIAAEVDVVAIAALNAIGVLTVLHRLRLEAATGDAVARLHALYSVIPICSQCRKVRGEVTGWVQLEQYVRDHSEAQFAPELCPDCLKTRPRATSPAVRS